jgi:hypothetical protein
MPQNLPMRPSFSWGSVRSARAAQTAEQFVLEQKLNAEGCYLTNVEPHSANNFPDMSNAAKL